MTRLSKVQMQALGMLPDIDSSDPAYYHRDGSLNWYPTMHKPGVTKIIDYRTARVLRARGFITELWHGGIVRSEAGRRYYRSGCECMTEDLQDGEGERVVTHSSSCPANPDNDFTWRR